MDEREQFDLANEIFLDLCDLPADQRAAALDERCSGDPALRARVERMLQMDEAAAGPFGGSGQGLGADVLAASMATDEQTRQPIPTSIGEYRVVREIGRGGMGVVYEAAQERPSRTVALKVLRELVAGRETARRFEREANLLGVLSHPGIATVHEAGSARAELPGGGGYDVSYFAMELVRGQPIDDHIAERSLGRRATLELVAKVCDAVQHAHDNGVIHRDIKPDNILIDEHSEPKVLDFGIARITDADVQTVTLRTEVGQLIGTVAYMSPEQLAGDPDAIDERTDVYSLGVVLFRLLSGRMPFELRNKPIVEVARIVQHEDPTTLSTIDRTLRGDAETIVLTAMEKDPGRRYQSPAALAADIRRYLGDEPLVARPASTVYQLRKFARRNKTLVAGVTASFVLLVLGVIGTTIGLVSALDANAELATANQELEQTNETLEEVARFQADQLSAVDARMMGVRMRERLLASAPEDRRARLDQDLSTINFTDEALRSLDTEIFGPSIGVIGSRFAERPLVRARLLQTLADTMRELGLFEAARAPQEQALAIHLAELGVPHERTRASMINLGTLLMAMGELDTAGEVFSDVVDRSLDALGPDHPDILRARGSLAAAVAQSSDRARAAELFREVLADQRRVLGDTHKSTLTTIANLASCLEELGEYEESTALAREALETRRRTLEEDDPAISQSLDVLAGSLVDQNEFEEAEQLFREALASRRANLGDGHLDTLTSMNNLAGVLDAQAKYEEAEQLYRESMEGLRAAMGPDSERTLIATGNLGYVMNLQGKAEESEPYYRAAYEGLLRSLGDEHPSTLIGMGNLASLLLDIGRADQAEPLFRKSLETRKRVLGADHPSTIHATFNMGSVLVGMDRLDEAQPYCEAALAGFREIGGDEHPGTHHSLVKLGDLRLAQGRIAEAEALFGEAIEIRSRVLGADHPLTTLAEDRLAQAREQNADGDNAAE